MKTEIELHEKECRHRPVECPVWDCLLKTVPFEKLLNHISQVHRKDDDISKPKTYKQPSFHDYLEIDSRDFNGFAYWYPTQLEMDGVNFFFSSIKQHGKWHFWVAFLGSQKEADKFEYSIRIVNENNKEEIMYRGPVISIDNPSKKILDSGCCLTFTNNLAKRFMKKAKTFGFYKEDSILEYSITLGTY